MGWKKNKIQRKPIGFIGLLFISINIYSDFVLESINNHKESIMINKTTLETTNFFT